MKERLHYLDTAKGILMCLVVFHHFPYVLTNLDSSYNIELFQTFEILYTSFFMGAFFMITGVTFRRIDNVSFLKKNIRSLILPGILLSVVCSYVQSLILDTDFSINPLGLLLWGGSWWFLLSLFTAKFFLNVLINYISNIRTIILLTFGASSIICFLHIIGLHSDPAFIQQSIILTPYLVLGYAAKIKIIRNRWKLCLLAFGFTIFIVLCFHLHYPCMTMVIALDASNIVPFFVLSYTGCLLFYDLSKKINKASVLEAIGKKSLYIYLVHITVMYACLKVLFVLEIKNLVLLFVISFLFTIFCSYYIALFINFVKSLYYDKRYSK